MPEALDELGHFGAITLVLADVDVVNDTVSPDYECRRARDVDPIRSERVINAVALRDDALLIQQEGKRYRMFRQIFLRLEQATAFFGGDKNSAAKLVDLVLFWLELGQAFHAVRSPGPAQEFQHCGAFLQNVSKRKTIGAIRCGKRELGRAVAHFQCVGGTGHLSRL